MSTIWIPSNNYGVGWGQYSSAVVEHIACCDTLDQLDAWFANPTAGVSSNYGVGRDGVIHQYVDSIVGSDAAYVHGIINQPDAAFLALYEQRGRQNPNVWAPGVEHVGWSGEPMPQQQFDASTWLTAWLCDVCGILPSQATILGHYEIDAIARAGCPGWDTAFWIRFVDAVRAMLGLPPEE
jgi:N-acetyl-anhydromuramyl-L-alanine amidase AmpD